MEPFKNKINPESVRWIAKTIPGDWNREAFKKKALHGLEDLELKARVVQIADALAAFVGPYPDALSRVLAGLGTGPKHTEGLTDAWAVWPICTWVERHGLQHPDLSLTAMEQLTAHWTCEFAIRPYFVADPEGVIARTTLWAQASDVHLRRLVSEGTRPRLPWGIKLAHRIEHPERMLPALEQLRDDPEHYVRRSVANHLNDISKDHPDWVIEVARSWWEQGNSDRCKLLKHALRTLIKAGDARAFALIGLLPFQGQVEFRCLTKALVVGDALKIELALGSTAATSQRVRIDLGLHFLRKNGSRSIKVFHWSERTVQPGKRIEMQRSQLIRRVSTRKLYAGEQAIDLRINGIAVDAIPFDLQEFA